MAERVEHTEAVPEVLEAPVHTAEVVRTEAEQVGHTAGVQVLRTAVALQCIEVLE